MIFKVLIAPLRLIIGHCSAEIHQGYHVLDPTLNEEFVQKELSAIGLRGYRKIFKPSRRVIYRVMTKNVHIMVIADGGRDMGFS